MNEYKESITGIEKNLHQRIKEENDDVGYGNVFGEERGGPQKSTKGNKVEMNLEELQDIIEGIFSHEKSKCASSLSQLNAILQELVCKSLRGVCIIKNEAEKIKLPKEAVKRLNQISHLIFAVLP